MASFFLDTSAAVKRYVQETGTTWFRTLTDPANGHYLYLVRITDVEITSAIARRRKGPTLTVAKAATALNQFRLDFAQDYRIIEVAIPLLQKASQLADLHALSTQCVKGTTTDSGEETDDCLWKICEDGSCRTKCPFAP